jgi:hypothetical protein
MAYWIFLPRYLARVGKYRGEEFVERQIWFVRYRYGNILESACGRRLHAEEKQRRNIGLHNFKAPLSLFLPDSWCRPWTDCTAVCRPALRPP